MESFAKKGKTRVDLVVLAALSCHLTACARVQAPPPKVVLPAASYPHSDTVKGATMAAVVFDPGVPFSPAFDPGSPPDFDWLKAGVCPLRLIVENHSPQALMPDPAQITATDIGGVTYQPYNPQEARDAVIARRPLPPHVPGAVAGAILGGSFGGHRGREGGSCGGGGHWAGKGAAVGAASGGTEGLVLGAGASRAELELRVRRQLSLHQLPPKTLPIGARRDGVVYFPAKD